MATGKVLWQDGDSLSETNLSETAALDNVSDYVERGLTLNYNSSGPDVDIGSGFAIVRDDDAAYFVKVESELGVELESNDTNYIYLTIDPGENDAIDYETNTDEVAPDDPNLLIGEVDTDADETTDRNRLPDGEFDELSTVSLDYEEFDIDATLDANDNDIINVAALDVSDGIDFQGSDAENVGNLGEADGFASLNGDGKIPTSELPSLAITEVDVVADESERLGLDAEEGDVAIQEDNDTTYILAEEPADENDNWTDIEFDTVSAIEGQNIEPQDVDARDIIAEEITNQKYLETSETESDAGSSQDIDLAVSNQHKITLTEDCDITFSNFEDGASVTLYVEQDGTGGHSVTWESGILWDEDNEPSVSDGADEIDRFVFDQIDGDIYGSRAGRRFA